MTVPLTGALTLTRAVVTQVVSSRTLQPVTIIGGTSGALGTLAPKDIQHVVSGSFRQYGQNTRLVVSEATSDSVTIAMRNVVLADLTNLNALTGKPVRYRDPYGGRIYGAFLATDAQRYIGGGGAYDVGFALTSLPDPEAV